MNSFETYQEKTKFNRISNSELIDGRNYRIENETDFDILNFDDFTMDLINRFGDDGETITINIYNKSTQEIIKLIEKI